MDTGMSLRDWFAGMALQGILSDATTCEKIRITAPFDYGPNLGARFSHLCAEMAYESADAMLKERDK